MMKTWKKSSLKPKCRWPWKFVCSIGYSSTTKFVQMMTLVWPLHTFSARSNLVPYVFIWEKVKTMDFSETIVVCDIKVGRCSQQSEYIKLYEYQWTRSLIDFGPNLLDSIFLNFFFSITTRLIEAKFHMEPPWDGRMKAHSTGPGHMFKMATMPIYGKNHLKIFFFAIKRSMTLKLGIQHWVLSTTKFVQVMPLGWP